MPAPPEPDCAFNCGADVLPSAGLPLFPSVSTELQKPKHTVGGGLLSLGDMALGRTFCAGREAGGAELGSAGRHANLSVHARHLEAWRTVGLDALDGFARHGRGLGVVDAGGAGDGGGAARIEGGGLFGDRVGVEF